MTADELLRLIAFWFAPILAGAAAGLSLVTARRYRTTVVLMQDTLELQGDLLDQLEPARDPGREVHDRLAHSIEARLVWTTGPKVEPGHRRAAAQAIAAQLIDDIRRANLEVVVKEEAT